MSPVCWSFGSSLALIAPLFVPRCRRKIQQFKTNTQRTPNAHGQFSQVWDLAQLLRKKHRCIFMRKPEDGAPAGSRRGKWQIIVASPGSVNDAVLYGTNGHGTDGKYKTVEFNLVTNVISVFKRNDKTSHPAVPEFESGFIQFVTRPVCYSICDKENKWTILDMHESIQRCMPCTRPECQHRWVDRDFPDGSGFWLETECVACDRKRWTGPVSEGGSPAMIDMHEATANALNQLRMDYRLCLFHSDKAILDYFSLHLLIQVSPVVLSARSDFTGLGLGAGIDRPLDAQGQHPASLVRHSVVFLCVSTPSRACRRCGQARAYTCRACGGLRHLQGQVPAADGHGRRDVREDHRVPGEAVDGGEVDPGVA